MDQCTRCGHALGVGRYCVNCGQPRADIAGPPDLPGPTGPSGDVTSTAERPAVRVDPDERAPADPPASPWGQEQPGPAAPPPVYETPQRPRYPMYADDPPPPPRTPSTPLPTVIPAVPAETTLVPAVGETDGPITFLDDDHDSGRRSSVLPWVAVAAALLLVAGMGVFLLLGGTGGDDDKAEDPAPGGSTSATDDAGSSDPTTTDEPSSSEPASPTTDAGPGEDVAGSATVDAPTTADPGVDVDGNPVRYDADNMLDGQADTAWRAPGTAAGETIVFTLSEPTRLTSVGLINGYAKKDPGYDGYTANRRVLEVEWTFDDGTTASQTLDGMRSVQRLDVAVVTTTVRMRLVSVSEPAKAPKGRNFTAISTVELVGTPAS